MYSIKPSNEFLDELRKLKEKEESLNIQHTLKAKIIHLEEEIIILKEILKLGKVNIRYNPRAKLFFNYLNGTIMEESNEPTTQEC